MLSIQCVDDSLLHAQCQNYRPTLDALLQILSLGRKASHPAVAIHRSSPACTSSVLVSTQPRQPLSMPSTRAMSQHQRWHRDSSIGMHALLARDDHLTLAVHFPLCTVTDSSCITQRTNAPLGMRPLSAATLPGRSTDSCLLALVPARLHCKRHQSDCGMNWLILNRVRLVCSTLAVLHPACLAA